MPKQIFPAHPSQPTFRGGAPAHPSQPTFRGGAPAHPQHHYGDREQAFQPARPPMKGYMPGSFHKPLHSGAGYPDSYPEHSHMQGFRPGAPTHSSMQGFGPNAFHQASHAVARDQAFQPAPPYMQGFRGGAPAHPSQPTFRGGVPAHPQHHYGAREQAFQPAPPHMQGFRGGAPAHLQHDVARHPAPHPAHTSMQGFRPDTRAKHQHARDLHDINHKPGQQMSLLKEPIDKRHTAETKHINYEEYHGIYEMDSRGFGGHDEFDYNMKPSEFWRYGDNTEIKPWHTAAIPEGLPRFAADAKRLHQAQVVMEQIESPPHSDKILQDEYIQPPEISLKHEEIVLRGILSKDKIKYKYAKKYIEVLNLPKIHNAFLEGNMELVKKLAKSDKDYINEADENTGNTLLHLAILSGKIEYIERIYELGGKFDSLNKNHQTPLHYAALLRNDDAIKFFLDKKGIDLLSWPNIDELLLCSVIGGSKYVFKKLISKDGISLKYFSTFLNVATKWRHYDMAKYLLDKYGYEAFSKEGIKLMKVASEEGNLDIVNIKKLYEQFRDTKELDDCYLNYQNPLGISLIHYTIASNKHNLVENLIGKGANLDIQTKEGQTPLHIAVSRSILYSNFETIKLLLEKGANPNIKDKYGMTALHSAISYAYSDTIEEICKYNPDIEAEDILGNSPFKMAIEDNSCKLVAILLQTSEEKLQRYLEENKLELSDLNSIEPKKIIQGIKEIKEQKASALDLPEEGDISSSQEGATDEKSEFNPHAEAFVPSATAQEFVPSSLGDITKGATSIWSDTPLSLATKPSPAPYGTPLSWGSDESSPWSYDIPLSGDTE